MNRCHLLGEEVIALAAVLHAFAIPSRCRSSMAREHVEPDLAARVLDSLGLTVADLKAAGADPFDLEPLTIRFLSF